MIFVKVAERAVMYETKKKEKKRKKKKAYSYSKSYCVSWPT